MMDWYPGVPFRKRFWTVAQRADYLELVFLVFFMASALTQIISGERPGSVAVLIPNPWDTMMLWMLLIGCLTAIAGIFWLWKRVDSILLESIGDLAVGFVVFIYGITVLAFAIKESQPGGVLVVGPVLMLLGFGWFWKWKTLNGLLKDLRGTRKV